MSTSTVLLQDRTHPCALFPTPEDGAVMEISPPPLVWLAVDGVSSYRVVVENERGEKVIDATAPINIFVPRERLAPGKYRWDVRAGERSRGWWSFTVTPDATTQIVPTAEEILSKVPAAHPRVMYIAGDIPAIVERHAHKIPTLKRNIEQAYKDGF